MWFPLTFNEGCREMVFKNIRSTDVNDKRNLKLYNLCQKEKQSTSVWRT